MRAFILSQLPPRRSWPRILGAAAVLSTFVPWVLPARAAHGPTVRPSSPPLAFASAPGWLERRVPSPGELALEGRAPGEALPPRDRLIAMENVSTHEKMTFNVGAGGYVRSDQTPALEYFFRCRRTQAQGPINRRLVEVLANIAEHWPGRVIEFLSGYRTFPYGAPRSRHYIGQAVDLRVRGVPSTQVRDFVWRQHRGMGVGHYPVEDFVHVDTRGGEPEIAWSGYDEATHLQYNPLWASQRLIDHE
jgi:uncharacterized protein YcbK (DUF882 family)